MPHRFQHRLCTKRAATDSHLHEIFEIIANRFCKYDTLIGNRLRFVR